MSATKTLSEMFAEAAATEDFAIESAKLSFTEDMLAIMKKIGMSRVELARKMNVNPSRITALLRGTQNFTFDTAVRVARALNAEFCPKLTEVVDSFKCATPSEMDDRFKQPLKVFAKPHGAANPPELALAA